MNNDARKSRLFLQRPNAQSLTLAVGAPTILSSQSMTVMAFWPNNTQGANVPSMPAEHATVAKPGLCYRCGQSKPLFGV